MSNTKPIPCESQTEQNAWWADGAGDDGQLPNDREPPVVSPPEAADLTLRVRDHYDKVHRLYQDLLGDDLHHGLWTGKDQTLAEATRNLADLVYEKADLHSGLDLCDVGCGHGAMVEHAAREVGCTVTGITLSSRQGESARRRSGDIATILAGDWLTLPVASHAFDRVLAVESLEHMPDTNQALQKIFRVLRPGGLAVLVVTGLASTGLPPRAGRQVASVARRANLGPLMTPQQMKARLTATGFMLRESLDLTAAVKRTWSASALRAGRRAFRRWFYWRFLCQPGNPHRSFVWAVPGLWWAHRRGRLSVRLYVAEKPG